MCWGTRPIYECYLPRDIDYSTALLLMRGRCAPPAKGPIYHELFKLNITLDSSIMGLCAGAHGP